MTLSGFCARRSWQGYVASEGPTLALLEKFVGTAPKALPFTALVAYNDYMAEVALQFFARAGLRVPEDVSVAGFDGVIPSTCGETRRITSAAIPLEEVGAAAVRLLEWRLQSPGAPRRKVLVGTTLVEGDTVGKPTGPGEGYPSGTVAGEG